MSFGISGDDIVKLGKKAWVLWELGFSQAKNAGIQYADFGSDIQHFAVNLQKLGQLIWDVTRQVPLSRLGDFNTVDLKSLLGICGDFPKTLDECEQLLEDSANFERGHGNFIYNIRRNLPVEPQVTLLKDRVAFHNIKIATIFKPLELKLLLDLKKEIYNVHSDLASQITEVIENHGNRFVDGIIDEVAAPPVSPRVPEYLEKRFEAAIVATNPELRDQAKFPLAQGINAFHHHFEQSTSKFHPENNTPLTSDFFTERIPEPVQYLNLMKSIWIVQMIKQGDEYAQSMSDKLWKYYIWELDEKCQREFSRFTKTEPPTKQLKEPDGGILDMFRGEEFGPPTTLLKEPDRRILNRFREEEFGKTVPPTKLLKEPDRRILDLFREEEFGIWLEDEEEEEEFHYQSGLNYFNEILRIPLASQGRNRKEELVLLRLGDTKLEMHRLLGRANGSAKPKISLTEVNLEGALFVPLYASPRSPPEALNVVFKGDQSYGSAISLSFLKLKDLLNFQQAICGYKVAYDENDIKTHTYTTGLLRRKLKSEHGRVQIWAPRRLEVGSQLSQGQPGESSQHREGSLAPSTVRSSVTTNSKISSRTEDSAKALRFEKPGQPILVLYLTNTERGDNEMSFLTIEMDPQTSIEDHRCSCGRNRCNCVHISIERSGDLIARRVEAGRDREELNLASLGVHQKPKHPAPVKKMKYIQINFRNHDERIKFEARFRETQKIYAVKRSLYLEDMKNVHGFARMDAEFIAADNFFPHDDARRGPKSPLIPSSSLGLLPKPRHFEYGGNFVWEGMETYKNCGGVMSDILTISTLSYPQSHCYIARSVAEFLSEYYPAIGLQILDWVTKVCQRCQELENAPVQEVIAKDVTLNGRLKDGQLKWELSTNSQQLASEVKSALSWTLSALRCQPQDTEGLYSCTPASLDTGLPEMTRFRPTRTRSYCWTNLFSYACIAEIPSLHSAKEGLEIDFSLLVQLAAVDQEMLTEDGSILFGFDTALIPLDPPESRRWHFLATKGRQITPARVKRELGKQEEKSEESHVRFPGIIKHEHRKGNVYVGWCAAPVVRIGSDAIQVEDISMSSGLRSVREFEELTEKSSSNDVSFFSRIGFLGFNVGASGGKKKEKKFKQVSVVAKHTQGGNFEGILASARATPCILWDESAERAWLVSAVSALLFASIRYAKWKRYSFKRSQTNGQFGPAAVDHAPEFTNTTTGPETALRQSQMLLVDEADGDTVNDQISFEDIVKQMWVEMSIGDDLSFSSVTGNKLEMKESIFGYDLNEAVCGTRKYLRYLRVSPCIKSWKPLAHVRDAQVIFCRDMGTVIRCNSPTESPDCCTRNSPKGALSCLIEDLRAFYGACWDKPSSLPTLSPNAGALSIGYEYEWIPPNEVGPCSRSLQSIIATRKSQRVKLQKKMLRVIEGPKENGEVLLRTLPGLVTFGSRGEVVVGR